ncbi:MAG: lipopolysaccharide heptosyltransferase II, partial [Bdellovibrionales bacterium]|nr:lipopolysaccharide heptosyltransferase II [Bdellovibrionales bacterium]
MKILVIRFSSLGDVVLTTAIFPNLRAHWPQAEISVLTKSAFAPVFDNNPHVDHVWVFAPEQQSFGDLIREVKAQNYDVIIDLHGTLRSWMLRLFAGAPLTVAVNKETLARNWLVWFKQPASSLSRSVRERILDCLQPLDVPVVSSDTQLFPKHADQVLASFDINPQAQLIGLAPGARYNTKRWPDDQFAEAGNRLGAFKNSQLLVLGDKNDQPVAERVFMGLKVPAKNLAGWTSLPELFAVVSKLSLLITNDSSLLHIGEALKIPLVAIFGPTVRGFGFAPYQKTSRVAEVINLPCRPCTLHGGEECPLKHHLCMKDVDVNAVLYTA